MLYTSIRCAVFISCLLFLTYCIASTGDKIPDPTGGSPQSGFEFGKKAQGGGPVPTLIGGKPVDKSAWPSVVKISTGNAGCTATLIGPRVIVTAAHCAKTGAKSTFSINQVKYTATMERSAIYPGKDHDMSLGILDKPVTAVEPSSVGGKPEVGHDIVLLGYGCTKPGGGGGNDGILRFGGTKITGFSGYDFVMKDGAALCFGDSGGPAFMLKLRFGQRVEYVQVGVNSKGNIKDVSYDTNLNGPESQSFLQAFASKHQAKICGVTDDCGAPPLPKFVLENDQVKVEVIVKDENIETEYVKTNVGNLLRFLETSAKHTFFEQ